MTEIKYDESKGSDKCTVTTDGGEVVRAMNVNSVSGEVIYDKSKGSTQCTVVTADGQTVRAMNVVDLGEGGGGGGDFDKSKVVNKADVMPVADSSTAGQVYMYTGETDSTYTHGYIYENVATTTSSSASATQTVGATLSDIAVDVDTLESFTGWTTDNSLQIFYTDDGWSVDATSLGVTYTGTPNVGDAITITYTAGSATYAWTRIDVQPTAPIVQYSVMPTPSAAISDRIVQYVGATNTYKKGYFYLCVPTYSDPSATIAQTVGSGLTSLAVNVNTFVAAEQPSGDEQVDFVSSVAGSMSVTSATQYGVTIDVVDQGTLIAKGQEILDNQYPGMGYVLDRIIVDYYQADAASPIQVYLSVLSGSDGASGGDIAADVASYGLSVSGTLDPAQYAVDNNILDSTVAYTQTWAKGGVTVDVADYGISYTGTPADGDTLAVSYTAPFINGYAWQEQEVQVSTTITVSMES